MKVQSIKQSAQNTTMGFLNINEKILSPFFKNNQQEDQFVTLKTNKKINFGANAKYYAQKYCHADDLEKLVTDIWENEFTGWQKFWNPDECVSALKRKTEAAITEIGKMREEVADEARRQREMEKEIEQTRRWQEREERRLREQEEELQKKLKLDRIQKEKDKLSIEGKKLDIEGQQIELDRKKLRDERLSIYTDSIKSAFISRAQVEKAHPEQKIGAFPNGIMLIGFDKKTAKDILEWTVANSECRLKTIDFEKLSSDTVLTELSKAAQEAQKTSKRTLLHIVNFDKFTRNIPENQAVIPKLKAFLSNSAEKYKCTVITEVDSTSKLATEITADQRFKVKILADNW